jgi:5-methylcytosine-specific restriction endonuclease McrA
MPYRDYKNKMREYMHNYYHNRRRWLCEVLPHGCSHEKDEFHIDHIDPSKKKYKINKVLKGLSKEKLAEEMPNLQILCPECHKEKTDNER